MIKNRFKVDPTSLEAWYNSPTKSSTLRDVLGSSAIIEAQALLEDVMMKSITSLTLSSSGNPELDSLNAVKRNAFLSGYVKAFEDLSRLTEQKYNKKSKILDQDEWSHITPTH